MNLNNWMKNISDNRNIKEINIPGSHDSATKFCRFSFSSCCQKLNIEEQLKIGVRMLDIRVDGENAVHSFCKCKKTMFGDVLKIYDIINDVLSFLKNNPSETVLMSFKDDYKISGEECLEILSGIIEKTKDNWYLENRFPTIGEARGKIILVNRINSNIGIDFSKMPYQGGFRDTHTEDFSPNHFDTVTFQDRYSVSFIKKWNSVLSPLLQKTDVYNEKMILNFISCAGFTFLPRINSLFINSKLKKFPLKSGKYYGTLMLDFADEKITKKIISTNF